MTKQYVLEFGSEILPRLLLLLLLQEKKNFPITSREKEYLISPAGNHYISNCNCQDAGSRFVLHGSKVDSDVAVVCKDTDVLILIVSAYSVLNITNNWYLKYDHEKFADIRKICSYLDKTLGLNLPKIQALIRCNTTSYFYRVGKIKVLKKCSRRFIFFIVRVSKLLALITNNAI